MGLNINFCNDSTSDKTPSQQLEEAMAALGFFRARKTYSTSAAELPSAWVRVIRVGAAFDRRGSSHQVSSVFSAHLFFPGALRLGIMLGMLEADVHCSTGVWARFRARRAVVTLGRLFD